MLMFDLLLVLEFDILEYFKKRQKNNILLDFAINLINYNNNLIYLYFSMKVNFSINEKYMYM